MTVIGSNISWTHSTWNLAIGCTKVSAGCDHCYAEELVNRSGTFKQRFDQVVLKLDRLSHVRKFRPLVDPETTRLMPHMVFVNSMSDFWHSDIPDETIGQILDVMEQHPETIFQILTKRPVRARKLLADRYRGKGIPPHIWIGVSAEDNRVAGRLNIMRRLREQVGSGTFFVSVEPIVGPTDKLDLTGIAWTITGGESGPRARKMEKPWLMAAIDQAQRQGSALWHKQNGTTQSHPNLDQVPGRIKRPGDQFRWLRENGWEVLAAEKGGATVDKQTYRALPDAFETVRSTLGDLLR